MSERYMVACDFLSRVNKLREHAVLLILPEEHEAQIDNCIYRFINSKCRDFMFLSLFDYIVLQSCLSDSKT